MESTGVSLQDALLGVLGGGGILWAVYEKWTRHKVETASSDSNVSESRANEALFNMLTNRLEALETEVRLLRIELNKERDYTRVLVNAMVQAGITPPAYPT